MMVVSCQVLGCTNRKDREKDRHFYRLPKVIKNQGDACENLSSRRRRLWIAALQQNLDRKNLDNVRICSDHFISGERADLYQADHPDWIPSVKMGTGKGTESKTLNLRFERRMERKRKSQACEILREQQESHTCSSVNDDDDAPDMAESGTASQTEISNQLMTAMQEDLQTLRSENINLRETVQQYSSGPHSKASFEGNSEKVKHFTGLSSFSVLLTVYTYLESYLPVRHCMDKFQMMILTFMRLRMNMTVQFLAYEFNVSTSTVCRIFSEVMDVMYVRLKPLIFWPDRETLQKSMPMQFRRHFGTKCAVIIECFEVFVERPSKLKSRAETWSSYKHHNTIKFLLGITPQGTVSFISRSWGGRTSDKYITENSGFLNYILPGDLILADRGFDISATIGSRCAEVKIPAFTKGRNQLSPLDVEYTRKLANVRIHVERVIGLVRQKYTILNGTLPIDMLICREGDSVPTVDKIAHVCCALVNLCESVVSFD